jgi:superfamily II DNA or RNA helicase
VAQPEEFLFGRFYRGVRGEVLKDFLAPAVFQSANYDRAVGFFTACSISLIADSLRDFGGLPKDLKIRIVASPKLSEQDITEIENGYEARSLIAQRVLSELDEVEPGMVGKLGLVGSLIEKGKLEIKIAYTENGNFVGDYHEKLGILTRGDGLRVGFIGSLNETCRAMVGNFESIAVFSDASKLDSDAEDIDFLAFQFNQLWHNLTPGLEVIDFPNLARERLIEISRQASENQDLPTDLSLTQVASDEFLGALQPPFGFELRAHQKKAVEKWVEGERQGVLKMATGAGKTKTSLYCAYECLSFNDLFRDQPALLLVIAPTLPLVEQWIDELRDWGVEPIDVSGGYARWHNDLRNGIRDLNQKRSNFLAVVVTNKSLGIDTFQKEILKFSGPGIIIGDEVHNLGASKLHRVLPENHFDVRIGLSATPERYNDEIGTARVFDYFGPICFEYTLGEAIADGTLCPYNYYPRVVRLSPEETSEYVQIVTALVSPDGQRAEKSKKLLARREHLLNFAVNKLDAFRNDIRTFSRDRNIIVFCAEGSTDVTEAGRVRHIELVTSILGHEMNMLVETVTGEDPRAQRTETIMRFADGTTHALAAMKVLNEGVDIPSARVAFFLENTANPREFVQRRGRVLRKHPGKTNAEIYDYLVIPSAESKIPEALIAAHLAKELSRAKEFASIAMNSSYALNVISTVEGEFTVDEVY